MQDIPKIVRQQLKASTPALMRATAELHPDADLLTAFTEHSLAGTERASVVEHLTRCGDCRDVIALALPATEIIVTPATPTRSGWFSLPVLRWGVVAAALVAVTSVEVQQYRLHHHEQIVASNVIERTNTTTAAIQNVQPIPQTPTPKIDSKPLIFAPRVREGTKKAHLGESMVATASSAPASAQQPSDAAPATEQTTAQNQVQDQLIQNQKERPSNGSDVTNVDTVAKAKDPVPAAVFASPRWAITPVGTLQRSLDDGQTWQDINPATAYAAISSTKKVKVNVSPNSVLVFRTVAAAGLEVWVGGSDGVLYHTVDGGSGWTLVLPSASGTILTGDITSIQFPDPQHGTVATSTAEVWITADDGQTWHKQ